MGVWNVPNASFYRVQLSVTASELSVIAMSDERQDFFSPVALVPKFAEHFFNRRFFSKCTHLPETHLCLEYIRVFSLRLKKNHLCEHCELSLTPAAALNDYKLLRKRIHRTVHSQPKAFTAEEISHS